MLDRHCASLSKKQAEHLLSLFRTIEERHKQDKPGGPADILRTVAFAIFSFLLVDSVLPSNALEYRCGVRAQECEQRCFQSQASAECLGKCNDEYKGSRDSEERARKEEDRKATIVPPNVWTPDGVKSAK
jgi:hypothetical protein